MRHRKQRLRLRPHMFGVHLPRLLLIHVGVLAFAHAIIGEDEMPISHYAGLRQTGLHAGEDAAIEREDGAVAACGPHQPGHTTTDSGDARHFGETCAIEADGKLVRHLRRA